MSRGEIGIIIALPNDAFVQVKGKAVPGMAL